jgi:hypothetical protein
MKTVFVFLLLITGFCAGAQDSLLVYGLKGKAYLKIADKLQPLKIGSKFSGRTGRLEIEKGSSVTLISSASYEAKEFTKSSAMNDVWKSFSAVKKTDVTGKYFSYVWEQFTHKHGSPEADRRKYMSNAGGVARGCPGVEAAHLPDTIFYTGKTLQFIFENKLPPGRLHFSAQRKNPPADSVWRIAVDSSAVVFPEQQQLKAGTVWIWSLQIDKQQPCQEGVIVYVTQEEYMLREKELKQKVMLTDPKEAANVLAFLLEESGYLDAAQEMYRNNP